MMRGEPDRSSGEGLGARGVNDKVVWGEGTQARGGAGAREADRSRVGQPVGWLGWTVGSR
jgi:hypothetical protein